MVYQMINRILSKRKLRLYSSKMLKVLSVFLFLSVMPIKAGTFLQETLSFNFKNTSIKNIFAEIEKASEYRFLFTGNLGNSLEKKVTVRTESNSLTEILDIVVKNTNLKYNIVDKQIIVSSIESAKLVEPKEIHQYNRTIKIKGKVYEADTTPLVGVTIIVKGTNLGTTTDVNGMYEIDIPLEGLDGAILQFSYIGFKVKEVVVSDSRTLPVVMEEDISMMAELIVTGVFTRKSDSYTGSVKTIGSDEIEKVGNLNLLQALKNIDPSFQVLESNLFGSDPNQLPDIQMRGASSFSDMKNKYQTNPNQPLFIVDGFEQNISKVMDMDMNRVESVTLLKDATAKAIYGSKGANGVIVIETKKPASGRLRVNYTGSLDIQSPDLTSYNLSNAYEKLEIERLAGVYTSSSNNPIQQQIYDEMYYELKKEVDRGVNTYWLNKPLRVGVGNKHSLNFEGGDDFVRYSIDVNYNDVKGVMIGSGRENFGGGFMFSYRYKNLLFREHLSLLHNKAVNSPYGEFSEYAKLNPYWRAYNEDGTIKEVIGNYNIANSQRSHPIYNPLLNTRLNSR